MTSIDGELTEMAWDNDAFEQKGFKEHLAPIVIFTYNRYEHTKATIEALKKNIYAENSDVFIYSDAPKNNNAYESVKKVRDYLQSVSGFKSVSIVYRENNVGLAANIIEGVTAVVNQYGKVIVLEDDLVTSKYFLKYMNDALELYKENKQVMEISGYSYPMNTKDLPQTMFLHFGDCWGWSTWKDRWELFKKDPDDLIRRFTKDDIYHFNLEGSFDYWKQVLANKTGDLNTWAIFWTAIIYLNDGLLLYPRDSLVRNIGFDATGDHGSNSKEYLSELKEMPITEFPTIINENKLARTRLKEFHKKLRPNIVRRIYYRVKMCLNL